MKDKAEKILEEERSAKSRNKEKDKRILIKFIVLIIAGFVIGILIGVITNWMQANVAGGMNTLLIAWKQILCYLLPGLLLFLNLAMVIVSGVVFRSTKKLIAGWDGEDEEVLEQVEEKLNIPIIIVNIMMVMNFMLYAVITYLLWYAEMSSIQGAICQLLDTIIFLAGIVIIMAVQKKAVDLEKQLNPEKEGNIFDMKFQTVWENSCDEAQKLMMYKAGYQSFKITNYACMVICMICFFVQITFQTGIMPVMCVSVIWMILVVTYSVTSYRLQKRN